GSGQNYSMIISALADVPRHERGAGLYVNPDHLAGLLEIVGILGVSIAAWSRWPSWARVVVAYLTGLCYLGHALTGSRGGYLSSAISIGAFGVLSLIVLRAAGTARLLKTGAISFGLLVAAVASVWFVIQRTPALSARAANTFTIDQGRIDLWRAAIEQWRLSPLFGTGSGTYLFYGRLFRAPALQLDPVDVHNDYLHLLCEYGLIGAALFAVFLVVHLRAGWRTYVSFGYCRVQGGALLRSNRVALSIAALSAFAAYAVHSLVDFNLHIPANALLVAFIFGTLANSGDTAAAPATSPTFFAVARYAAVALALIVLVQSVRLWPGEASVEAARVALRDENPKLALAQAREAARRDDRNPLAFFYLGRALAAIGNRQKTVPERTTFFEEAVATFDQARLLSPMDAAYPLELARLYDFMGRYEEAEWMFFLARARDPRSENVQARYEYHLNLWRDPESQTPR
ncbi:MAG: O-antigen ligase family protein, partial [Chthoniobacterales bacterium]